MNKCIFMGRLTRDPEIRYTQSEKPVAVINYTLAVDRRYNIHKQRGQESLCYGIYRRGSRVHGKQEGSRRRTGNGKRRFYADAGRRRITV